MFINQLNDLTKAWRFRLIDGSTIVGQLLDCTKDTSGHLMMIKVREGASPTMNVDIPWHSVVHVTALSYRRD